MKKLFFFGTALSAMLLLTSVSVNAQTAAKGKAKSTTHVKKQDAKQKTQAKKDDTQVKESATKDKAQTKKGKTHAKKGSAKLKGKK